MRFSLTALFDDETRKQLREAIFGEARAVAREELDKTVLEEIKRIVGKLGDLNDRRFQMALSSALQNLLMYKWTELGGKFRDFVKQIIEQELDDVIERKAEQKVNAKVGEKLKNKTVWEAEAQDEYVRKVARQEVRKIYKTIEE